MDSNNGLIRVSLDIEKLSVLNCVLMQYLYGLPAIRIN